MDLFWDPNSSWCAPWVRQAAADQQPPPQPQVSYGYYNNNYYASGDYNYAYYAYEQPPATYVPLTALEIREELQSLRDDFRSTLQSFRILVENLQEQERNGAPSDLSESELKIDTDVGDDVNIALDVATMIVDVDEKSTKKDEGMIDAEDAPHLVVQMDTESSIISHTSCLDHHYQKPLQLLDDGRINFYGKLINNVVLDSAHYSIGIPTMTSTDIKEVVVTVEHVMKIAYSRVDLVRITVQAHVFKDDVANTSFYLFDPGGHLSPRCSLLRGSHLEDKVNFNRGRVDTRISGAYPIDYYLDYY